MELLGHIALGAQIIFTLTNLLFCFVRVLMGTPPDIAKALEKAFLDTVNSETYRTKIQAAGFVPLGLNSEESIKYIAAQTEICARLLKEHNLLLKK